MKVQQSQIKESNGNPEFYKKNGEKVDNESKNNIPKTNDDSEEEKPTLSKNVILFQEEGVMISAYDLHTIEKDMRFVEKPTSHFEFGIVINKGLTPGQFVTKVDLCFWYSTAELRDQKYDLMIQSLKDSGLKIITI